MKRSAPLRANAKASATVKPIKPKKCNKAKGGCGATFTPSRPFVCWCSPECGLAIAQKQQAKKAQREAIEDHKETRAKLERLRPISKVEEECRQIVQKIARIRDRDDGCISCELPANWDGQWHGSHFRSHGACSALQFHLWNIHKACWICNKLYSGRINQYEPRLIVKIGAERFEWLMAQNQVVRPDRVYLARFKRVMGRRMRRMEARAR